MFESSRTVTAIVLFFGLALLSIPRVSAQDRALIPLEETEVTRIVDA